MNIDFKKILTSFLVVVFVLFVFSSNIFADSDCDSIEDEEKREECEDSKDDIDKIEDKIEDTEKDLQESQVIYNQKQSQVYSTQSAINKTEEEISRKEDEIKSLRDKIKLDKEILGEYIRQLHIEGQLFPLINFVTSGKNFSESMKNFDSLVNLKQNLIDKLKEIEEMKGGVEDAKGELAEKKEEHEDLLGVQVAERNKVGAVVQEKKLTLSELNAKLNKLRSTLSSFLGSSFSMDDVIDAVKYADKKTGVRKEFLFAVLDKETDLGRFTGGCTYKNTRIRDENPDDKSAFKDICKDLGYDYKKMKVSCALSYGYGGAMGVAQFMPTTWNGYKDAISDKTGNDPADPWDLKDGIMGMALYLKNKGGDKKSGEYQAAAMYYCGGNWKRTVCYNYADAVISWSKGYDDYF